MLLLLAAVALLSQSFDVMSVKIHAGSAGSQPITTSGPRLRASARGIGALILYAYHLKDYELAWNTPDSPVDRMMFDIEAKAEDVPTAEGFRRMMQSLLAERFQLRVHHEMREMQVYALVVGKNGPKFKESAPEAVESDRHFFSGRTQTMTLSKSTMDNLAVFLPYFAGRPVVDRTGLAGTYDLKLEATSFGRIDRNPDPTDINIFSAIQDQLGLKLEAQKATIDVLVVDHFEKPSEN